MSNEELLKVNNNNKPWSSFCFTINFKTMRTFGQVESRFPATDGDPLFGTAFYLEAVQLENINGKYTDWIPLSKLWFNGYGEEDLLPIGKNMKEWINMKKKISEDYCEGLNWLTKGNITPFKQMVALKIRYLGEPKKVTHVFHYYAPRNP